MNARRVCMLAAVILCSGSLLAASAADKPQLKSSATSIKDVMVSGPSNLAQTSTTPDSSANTAVVVGKVSPDNTTSANPRLVPTNQGTQAPWTPATPSHGFAYGARGVGFDGSPGTDAPPALLSGFPMTPFPTDPRPVGTEVTDIPVPAPCSGVIGVDPLTTRRAIGSGWASWSHDYTGDVYTFYEDPGAVTLTMPADVCAIYFYVEPNTFTPAFDVTCVANLGLATEVSSGPVPALGDHGAVYFGFFASAPDHIETVTITVDPAANGWAFGELGIACGAECVVAPVACCFEATATCYDQYDLTQCIAEGGRYSLGVEFCADLDPLCGQLIGACCAGPDAELYEPYECIGDMTQVECYALAEEDTNWTFGESCAGTPPFDCNEPTYCDVSYTDCGDRDICESGGSPDDWIMNVTFAEINNTTGSEGCPNSYGDYTDLVAYVAYGVTYNLSVETCGEGSWSECTTAWIDWNGDKVFDNETERYDLGCGTNVVLDMDITVPPTAMPGFTRMRVIEAYNAAAADACAGGSYGETEDYTIMISGEVPTGACCDPTTGVCVDDVLATECLPPSQFAMDALCADAFPNCGNPGACCDDETGDCEEDVLELSCTGTRFVAGGLCADLDPTCGDVPWLFDFTPGFEAPPEYLFSCPMTPFPLDERATGENVNDIPWPCPTGGTLLFDIPMSHRRIGDGWMSWSHGYTGDVYYTGGAQSITMTLDVDPPACGIYFYVEPNPFEDHLFTVTVNGFWVSDEFVANGEGLAAYAGVSGNNIETLTVASDIDFAIGEFGACCFCGEAYGSCCDPYTAICADNVEVRCCPAGHEWSTFSCADRVPACGNPGACCDITTGECEDEVLELNCEGGRFEAGGECEELEPPCGTPGACCYDDDIGLCEIRFEANCDGRFIAGEVCDPDPWEALGQWPCGEWECGGILYAPSNPDNAAFRDEIASLLIGGQVCDYWDSAASIPTLEDLLPYCCVFVWGNYAFADSVAYGDVLADFVDQGGKVMLGQWCLHTTQNNWLEGRIMEPEYCPVTGSSYGADSYVDGSGLSPVFVDVHSLSGSYFDQCDPIAGAFSDGLLAGGKIAAAWRPGNDVYYLPGATAPDLTPGDLAQLIVNACNWGGGDVYGACCDPTTGICVDDVLLADCEGQFAFDGTCADDFPNCGDRGACCNVYDGTCEDEILALDCPADFRHAPGEECDELEPECGTPGACCIDDDDLCTIEFEANCEGRFLAGATTCDPDPWEALGQPACGDWECGGILYAPSNPDNAAFRADIAALLGGGQVCDYWDSAASIPTLADLQDYCCVFVWGNYAFADPVGYGDVLADFVDAGGKVMLGQWCYHTTQTNWMEGRIMTEAYCPVTATSYTSDSYVDGSGASPVFMDVHALSGNYFDQCDALPSALSDGLLAGGKIAAAWRPDNAVYYLPGAAAPDLTSGDLAQLIVNACAWGGEPAYGACCDPTTGICVDDVLFTECAGQFAMDGTCAEDFPNCGNPGACCYDEELGLCETRFEVNCEGRFIAGAECDPDPWEALGQAACGEYDACEHSITMWDDYGDGWNGNNIDVYVDGMLVLAGATIASGSGPETVYFEAGTGSVIETVYNFDPGMWPYENSYCIYSGVGEELICDGQGGVDPTGVTTTGNCEAGFCGDGACMGDEDVCTCPDDCGAYECPTQAPNQTNGIFSDIACDACGSGMQFMAEHFFVCEGDEIEIDAIGFWGGYHPGNESIDDLFTVVIRDDDGTGLPGTAVLTLGPVAATTKETTGIELFGVDEYVYTIDLEPNLTLSGGTYWLEVYNDTTATTDSWFWEVGDMDAGAGLVGHAASFTMPEAPWTFDGGDSLAFEIICVSGKVSPKVDDRRLDSRRDSHRSLDVSPAEQPVLQIGSHR